MAKVEQWAPAVQGGAARGEFRHGLVRRGERTHRRTSPGRDRAVDGAGPYDGNGPVAVEPRGDIDPACAARLRTWLDPMVVLRASAYAIDLRAVSLTDITDVTDSTDGTGLNMFVRFRRRP
ncbi:hypothetical protein J8N05_25775 [Streptomyces sp. BH-SS-21]|uniref:Uncharacterized protein n=1 Tax=Streptomyces liliiviolaceus TaxID=2823109 RepID=A0A940Y371_9ACTN|nr:hypothetical protein [Streptomyces liliiviolaceus]MBQ0851580.1 hypothetical protein [Streptomyces liliiviolaceus]